MIRLLLSSLILCSLCLGADVDYLKEESKVRLFWNDDVMAIRDTVLTAVSIKRDGDMWRVLGKTGEPIYCDGWKHE